MLRIAICDDDLSLLKSTAKIVEAAIITSNFDAEVSTVTTKQSIIYNKIKAKKIDILLLDVDFNNNGKNGIEFALELRKVNKDFKLIFLTGHFEYSMLAFKCKTFDYILKPADVDKVVNVIERLRADYSETELGLIKINKDYTIRAKDILYIERNKSKATIHTCNNKYESCFSLNTIQEKLPSAFVRVHRSYIVNTEQITKIDRGEKSIYFTDNNCCPLGQFHFNK